MNFELAVVVAMVNVKLFGFAITLDLSEAVVSSAMG
jgi:hypothetical protein